MTKTNSLTNAVIDFIRLHGGAAWRVNVIGVPIVVNGRVTGFRKSPNKGMADVRAIWKGRSIDIEIKTGRDKQSPAQSEFESEVTKAGGQYWIVKDFDSFESLFLSFTRNTYKRGIFSIEYGEGFVKKF